jgi:CRISPR type III-A-associated protein Csm2
MEENQEQPTPAVQPPAPAEQQETAAPAPAAEAAPKREERAPQPKREPRPENRAERGARPERGGREERSEARSDRAERARPGGSPGGRPGGGGPPVADIDIEKLISDSLYLDNQAHAVVARMRDMDSGTKSQLRRLFNAVRRAVRAPESERQHQFVMLRARLAYTIARHSLRSLDGLERLLLQVTRKNDPKGYERFKDLFEAIVAYNE